MANYLQNQPLQFAPYQGIDVGLYTSVGMQRQQEYDAGVQKVQGMVDSVAGIDVIRDVDKQYLNTKVNDITTKLNNLASNTDYGNKQLLNQVGSLTNSIARDKNIQAAMLSTRNVRAGYTQLQADKEEGKSSVENEWDYNNQVGRYTASQDLGVTFNGTYSKPIDVMGEFMKSFKEIHPEGRVSEDMLTQGANGEVLLKSSYEGISPDQVKQVSNLVLSRPDIQNQLSISGRYKYRGYDGATLSKTITNNYYESAKGIEDKIKDLQLKQTTDRTQNASSIARDIQNLKNTGTQLLNQYNQSMEIYQAGGDDALKAHLYKTNFQSDLINSFSYGKTQQEIVANPLWEAQMKQKQYELELMKANHTWEKDRFTLALKAAKLNEDGTSSITGASTQVSDLPVSEQQAHLGEATYKAQLNSLKANANVIQYRYLNSLVPNGGIPPYKQSSNGSWVYNVGAGGYKTVDDARNMATSIYNNAKDAHMNGTATQSVERFFSELDPVMRDIKNMELTSKKIDAQYIATPSQKQSLDFLNNLSIPFMRDNGYLHAPTQEGTLSSDDLYKYAIATSSSPSKGEAEKALQGKYGEDAVSNIGKSLQSADPRVGPVNKYQELLNTIRNDKNLQSYYESRNNAYRDAQSAFVTPHIAFVTPDDKSHENMVQRYRPILQDIYRVGESDNVKKALEWLDDKNSKNTSLGYYKVGDQGYLTLSRGTKDMVSVPIDLKTLQSIPGVNLQNAFWQLHGSTLSLTGRTSTDINYDGSPGGSATAFSIPSTRDNKYRVKYHLSSLGDGGYSMKLYITDKSGNVVVNGSDYSLNAGNWMNEDQVMTMRQQLQNDKVVEAIIKDLNNQL